MPRLLLILPSSTYRAAEFLSAVEAIGAEPVVVTNSNPLLAMRLGSGFIDLDVCDREEITRRAVTLAPIDGVLSPDDSMVELANHLATVLGVSANSPEGVAATRDKASFRRALREVVPQPEFAVVEEGTDIARVIADLGPPVVLKPVSLSGSQGVIRVDVATDGPDVERRIRAIVSRRRPGVTEPLLVERFIPGAEVAVEGLLADGRLHVLAVFDKPDPLDGPYFEETIYVTPSRHDPGILAIVRDVVQAACTGLGLVTGPVHAELRIDGTRVVMIEMAARPIGGRCGTALRFGSSTTHEMILARAALGRAPDPRETLTGSVGSLMIPIPGSGILRAVDGVDQARAVPGVTGVDISIPIGETVAALPEGNRYLGFAYAATDSPAETEQALRRVMETVRPEIDQDRSEEPDSVTEYVGSPRCPT